MKIYIFSSKNIDHIHIAESTGMWASGSAFEGKLKQETVAQLFPVGSLCFFWASEKGLTMPFTSTSVPVIGTEISGDESPWEGTWHNPFKLSSLAKPTKFVSADELKTNMPVLVNSGKDARSLLRSQLSPLYGVESVPNKDKTVWFPITQADIDYLFARLM